MKQKNSYILLLLFILATTKLQAQVTSNDWFTLHRLNKQSKVMLRWMPPTATLWQEGRINGYEITRKTYSSTGGYESTVVIMIPPVLITDITTLPKWIPYLHVDSVYHQQLFNLTTNRNLQVASQLATTNGNNSTLSVDEERYFYANILADLSFKASELCGIGYVDNSVITGKQYEYTIKVKNNNLPEATSPTISKVVIGLPSALPNIPLTFNTLPKKITAVWETNNLADTYSSYGIQRAEKTGTSYGVYQNLNNSPYINTTDSTTKMYFADSIPNLTKTYGYRVVGKTFFDEYRVGTTYDIAVRKKLENAPLIDSIKVASGNITINWRYNGLAADIRNFKIAVSKSDTSKLGMASFKELVLPTPPTASARSITFPASILLTALGDTNSLYYVSVGVVGIENDVLYSMPYIVSPKDKTPPTKPTNLRVLAPVQSGTNSLIKVTWTKSTDTGVGILGYRVHRLFSNQNRNLKVEISNGITNNIDIVTNQAYVQDTLASNFDYTKVKYYVSAFDQNYNESATDSVEYTKPDTRRPSVPTITNYEVSYNNPLKVILYFTLSPESGVTHKLLKKENTDGAVWVEINLPATLTSYIDPNVAVGKTYVYSLVARDASGNLSCYGTPALATTSPLSENCYQLVMVKVANTLLKPAVTTLISTYQDDNKQIKINWTYTQPAVAQYELYRGVVKVPADSIKTALLTVVAGDVMEYFDESYEIGKAYKYQIRAAFEDGSVSEWKSVTTNVLTQKTLETNVTSLVFATSQSPQSIIVTSNISWVVTKDAAATWLTVQPTTGTNNGTISVSATVNTGTSRTATLTIAGGGLIQTIDVTQLGVPIGTGLTAQYYNYTSLAAIQNKLPDIARIEPTINFNVGANSPVIGINPDFVAVWQGFVEVKERANYVFSLAGDDGFNFYLNNKKELTANAFNPSMEFNTAAIELEPGIKYPLKIEFWDSGSTGALSLKWANNKGMSKQLIPTIYLYPLYIPDANATDPLHGKCFVIKNTQNNKVLQAMSNFLVQQQDFTGNNSQLWKFEKVGTFYKLLSQTDQQGKVMEVLGKGSTNLDKITLGYFNNQGHQLWSVQPKQPSMYQLIRSQTNAVIDILDDGNAILVNGSGREFKTEQMSCPATSNSLILDKNYVTFGSIGGSDEVVLTANIGWTASTSDSWIELLPMAGYGNGKLTLRVAANTETAERSGVVNINAENTTYTIYVKQVSQPTGRGLDASYFNVTSFNELNSAVAIVKRIDPTINFSWAGSPVAGVNENFSARWEGFIEAPATGDYLFYTSTDDGVKLSINGEIIVYDNTSHTETEFTSSKAIHMVAGNRYPIKMEFWDGGGSAAARLKWSNNKGFTKQLVASKYLYPSGINLTANNIKFLTSGGTEVIGLTADNDWVASIANASNWVTVSPVNGTASDEISIQVEPLTTLTARTTNITFTSAGKTQNLAINQYPVSENGVKASYFNVTSFTAMATATPVLTRTDSEINFSWTGSPATGINENFSARWEGYVSPPETGSYTFFCGADDGVRLFVNSIQTIYDNTSHTETEFRSDRTFYLEKGKMYPIKMEFWDGASGAAARLRWSNNAGLLKQIIGNQYLFKP